VRRADGERDRQPTLEADGSQAWADVVATRSALGRDVEAADEGCEAIQS